jgi:hypothetical protein
MMKMTGIWRLDSTKYRQRNAAGLLLKPAFRVVGSFLILSGATRLIVLAVTLVILLC